MTTEQMIALSRLLDEALDLETAQVEIWLTGLAPEHAELLPVLREMLSELHSKQIQAFLATGPRLRGGVLMQVEATVVSGSLVGPYRLLRELGHGGMGTVWLAERVGEGLRRKVALKLPRLVWDAGLAERMAHERDIAAVLEHPSIARLYDAGLDEQGRPYLAFEYIDGQPIDTWCGERKLGVRDRLKLVVEVTRAVAYAHGRLIVHRDIKPSNVLVASDGHAHLLDFGIAKLLGEGAAAAGLTKELGRMLTPQYASPEHMRGEPITVASDVYSLGVLSYVLLTGTPPHQPKRSSQAALEEEILQGEAAPASTRAPDQVTARALKGEVDAILCKALKREASMRYATADALADDIERHLTGERVLAQPDSSWYRLRKALRRHWVEVSAISAVVAAVVLGSLVAVVQAQRAAQSANREQLVKDFVSDVFRVNLRSDPANADLRQMSPDMLVDQGAKLIQTRFSGQPALQAELYGVVAGVFADMGAQPLAIDYSTRQIEGLEKTHADDKAMVRALLALAQALMEDERLKEAEPQARRAAQLAGSDDALGGEALVLLGRIQRLRGALEASKATLHQAADLLVGAGGKPSISKAWLVHLQALNASSNDLDRWMPGLMQAMNIAIQAEGARSRTAAYMQLWLGNRLIGRGRKEEALRFIEPALATLEKSSASDAIRAAVERIRLWRLMDSLVQVSGEEALAAARRSRSIVDSKGIAVPALIRARIDFNEALILSNRGRVMDAGDLMSTSLPILRPAAQAVDTLIDLIGAEAAQAVDTGHHDKAHELLSQLMLLRRTAGRGDIPFAAVDHAWISFNRLMQGRFDEAKETLDAAPAFGVERSDPVTGMFYADLLTWERARLALHRGDPQAALKMMQPLKKYRPNGQNATSEHALYAEALCAAGQFEEGLRQIRVEVESREARVDPRDPALARHRSIAGLCAVGMGDRRLAFKMAQAARAAFDAQPGVSPYFKAPLEDLERRVRL